MIIRRLAGFVVLAVLVVWPVRAVAEPPIVSATTVDGATLQADGVSADRVEVIVEFRDPPLFARMPPSKSAAAVRVDRRMTLQSRFAQFSRDLRGLQVSSQAAAGAAEVEPSITQTFQGVFAGVSVTASPATVARIASLSYVAGVYPDRKVYAQELDRGATTTLNDSVGKIKADRIWGAYGTYGAGIVVAVIDTGIDYTHPAFGSGFGPQARVIGGWDFVNKDSDPMDDNGHGTHVAGIIGGKGGGVQGVAPDVSFLAYKVLGKSGSGSDSQVIAGVERTVDPNQDGDPSDHADVANMSLGGPGIPDAPLPRAVETAVAAGVVFAVAAGNSGGFYTVSAPAIAPSVIAVGATEITDAIASFSSGGPSGTLDIKPEVVAPGVSIVSAAPGGGLASKSGTSMATPHVAGAAALLKAVHRDWSPQQIKSALVSTAEVLNTDVMAQGGGRIDALAAAGARVFTDPVAVSFGRATTDAENWSSTADIRVTNSGLETVSLTATATGGSEAIGISLDPSSLSLGAGQTETVTLQVMVNHALLPFPKQGSLALSGQVNFAGSNVALHVPWAFIKAPRLTIAYDAEDDLTAFVGGTTSSQARTVLMYGRRQIDVYEPPGDYDVLLYAYSQAGENRQFTAERRTVNGDERFEFSSAAPLTTITYASTDEKGRSLAEIGRAPGKCIYDLIVAYPNDAKLRSASTAIVKTNGSPFRMKVSPTPQNVSLTGGETCWDGASSVYVSQFGTLPTTAPSFDAAVAAGSWQKVPLGIVAPRDLPNQTVLVGASNYSVETMSALSQPDYARIPLNAPAWAGTLFIAPEQHAQFTKTAWVRLTADVSGVPGASVVDARVLRWTLAGIRLSPYRTVGPATYVAAPGESLIFGDGLAHPEPTVYVDGSHFRSSVPWSGSYDEFRSGETVTSAVLRDAAGKIVASGSSLVDFPLPKPGIYTYEITKSQTVVGFAADTNLAMQVDASRADPASPTLRCLRVVGSDGRPTTTLAIGENGRLRVAVLDLVLDPATRKGTYGLVVPGKIAIRWRPHGASEWQALPFTIEGEEVVNSNEEFVALGHNAAGTIVSSDLSAVTTTARGAIDLQIYAEDPSGNTLEYAISPAVVIGEQKRRAIAHR